MNSVYELLRPLVTDDKVRLGDLEDGGYVINRRTLEKTVLISLGVGDNWSFEKDFLKHTGADIYMFDASVRPMERMKKLINLVIEIFSLFFWINVIKWPYKLKRQILKIKKYFYLYKSFSAFISQDKVYYFPKLVSNRENDLHLEDIILEKVKVHDALFIKIDIDGDEYGLENTLNRHSNKIAGLAIEFHDIDRKFNQFKEMIETLKDKYYITHIHANNFSEYCELIETLTVFEISFINKEMYTGNPSYFQSGIYTDSLLDYPCNSRWKEFVISY
ncbi:MAG: FkbM family methyltransferase [Bacteroidetes bacterium]|nr:FkbM family methyltransferase [Bacteroidota bacterium]